MIESSGSTGSQVLGGPGGDLVCSSHVRTQNSVKAVREVREHPIDAQRDQVGHLAGVVHGVRVDRDLVGAEASERRRREGDELGFFGLSLRELVRVSQVRNKFWS